jgi:hypothetical protein
MTDFRPFPKIARLNRDVVITEKIDGTNACVAVTEDGRVLAQSRSRIVTPDDDNFGFAAWVRDHADDLRQLGVGYHFGEWWGQGIQRGYGLQERRFSLFDVVRWGDDVSRPACCCVVPYILNRDPSRFLSRIEDAREAIEILKTHGSRAAPGYMKPEGIIVYHTASQTYFKATVEKDNEHKEIK